MQRSMLDDDDPCDMLDSRACRPGMGEEVPSVSMLIRNGPEGATVHERCDLPWKVHGRSDLPQTFLVPPYLHVLDRSYSHTSQPDEQHGKLHSNSAVTTAILCIGVAIPRLVSQTAWTQLQVLSIQGAAPATSYAVLGFLLRTSPSPSPNPFRSSRSLSTSLSRSLNKQLRWP